MKLTNLMEKEAHETQRSPAANACAPGSSRRVRVP